MFPVEGLDELLHKTVPQTRKATARVASYLAIIGSGGRIRTYVNEFQRLAPFQLGHSVRTLELVDLARFERATSTFAESRSDSPELQVRDLAEADRS